jgi:hypothetical protein
MSLSGVLCRRHFQPGGGPEYCRACREDDLPCARGEPGTEGQLCPYRQHALISQQEHEAWDVLLRLPGPAAALTDRSRHRHRHGRSAEDRRCPQL